MLVDSVQHRMNMDSETFWSTRRRVRRGAAGCVVFVGTRHGRPAACERVPPGRRAPVYNQEPLSRQILNRVRVAAAWCTWAAAWGRGRDALSRDSLMAAGEEEKASRWPRAGLPEGRFSARPARPPGPAQLRVAGLHSGGRLGNAWLLYCGSYLQGYENGFC